MNSTKNVPLIIIALVLKATLILVLLLNFADTINNTFDKYES